MEKLNWKVNGPAPNPFEVIVGDSRTYRVHLAISKTTERSDVKVELDEVVYRAVSLQPEPPTARTLFESPFC